MNNSERISEFIKVVMKLKVMLWFCSFFFRSKVEGKKVEGKEEDEFEGTSSNDCEISTFFRVVANCDDIDTLMSLHAAIIDTAGANEEFIHEFMPRFRSVVNHYGVMKWGDEWIEALSRHQLWNHPEGKSLH